MRLYNIKETGKRIRERRIMAGYTHEELEAELGLSAKYFANVENGRRGCSVDVLVMLAQVLDVSLDYLLLGKQTDMDAIQEKINKAIELLESATKDEG